MKQASARRLTPRADKNTIMTVKETKRPDKIKWHDYCSTRYAQVAQ